MQASQNANKHYDYDAIIIGTGPGGEGAAMNLAKQHFIALAKMPLKLST